MVLLTMLRRKECYVTHFSCTVAYAMLNHDSFALTDQMPTRTPKHTAQPTIAPPNNRSTYACKSRVCPTLHWLHPIFRTLCFHIKNRLVDFVLYFKTVVIGTYCSFPWSALSTFLGHSYRKKHGCVAVELIFPVCWSWTWVLAKVGFAIDILA